MLKWKLLDKKRMKSDCGIKIIVDTNLWISFIELVVSQELLDEIADVASRSKFVTYFSKEHFELLWEFVTEEKNQSKIPQSPQSTAIAFRFPVSTFSSYTFAPQWGQMDFQ